MIPSMKPRSFKPRSPKEREEIKEAIKLIDEGNFNSNNQFIQKMNDTIKFLSDNNLMGDKDDFIRYFKSTLQFQLSPMADANKFVSPDPYEPTVETDPIDEEHPF